MVLWQGLPPSNIQRISIVRVRFESLHAMHRHPAELGNHQPHLLVSGLLQQPTRPGRYSVVAGL